MQQLVPIYFTPSVVSQLPCGSAKSESIVVSFVRATTMFDRIDVQNTLTMVTLGTEPKLADSEFRVWGTSEWVEIVVRITLLIGHNFVEFVGNAILCMLVGIVVGSLCRRSELPTPVAVTRRRRRCPRG